MKQIILILGTSGLFLQLLMIL